MTDQSKLDTILNESAEEVRRYLRNSLENMAVVVQKALETLDVDGRPVGEAERLSREAQYVVRLVGQLETYAELAEQWKEAE